MDTHSHAQAPRLPCSFTAAAQRRTVQLPHEGDGEREKDGGERAVIDRHQNLRNTSSSITLLSPYKRHSSLHKHFEIVLTDDHVCFVSVLLFLYLPMTHEEFTFCMNIFFTLDFVFHEKDIGRLRR